MKTTPVLYIVNAGVLSGVHKLEPDPYEAYTIRDQLNALAERLVVGGHPIIAEVKEEVTFDEP